MDSVYVVEFLDSFEENKKKELVRVLNILILFLKYISQAESEFL